MAEDHDMPMTDDHGLDEPMDVEESKSADVKRPACPAAAAAAAAPRKHRISDRLLTLLVIATIVGAWIIGGFLTAVDLDPILEQAMPEAQRFEQVDDSLYAGYDEADALLGYVGLGTGNGYGGPIEVATAIDLEGIVTNIAVVDQKETGAYYRRATESDFFDSFVGVEITSSFEVGEDVDAVSGATYSANGIADAVLAGAGIVAVEGLGIGVAEQPGPDISIGLPEILIVILFAAGWVNSRPSFKWKKYLRWATLIVGLIFIGFLWNMPLTLSRITSLMMGYFPEWQTNLYWYLLLGGVTFVYIVDNKDSYCYGFCPFGAAQEVLGAIGGAKHSLPRVWHTRLRTGLLGLTWLAVVLALLFRDPGLSSYEIFGTLFDFTGSQIMFAILAIVLVSSLAIRRPWCRYLCPLDPLYRVAKNTRNWIKETWERLRRRPAATSN